MLVVVHAAIKESPVEVEAEAGSRCDCSDKSRLITHAIIKNHGVGVCWFWRGLSTLIVHNCTGCHPRCAGCGAISASSASFHSESGRKKKAHFDHEISTINVCTFLLLSEKLVMSTVAVPGLCCVDTTAATTSRHITTCTWEIQSCSHVCVWPSVRLSIGPFDCSHVFSLFCHPTLEVTK